MTDTDIIFEDLPETRQGGGHHRPSKHHKIAEQLRERPKEWARVHISASRSGADSTAHQIRVAILRAYSPPSAFEAKARTVDGQHRVYARYVGEGGESA